MTNSHSPQDTLPKRYSAISQLLHWLTAITVLLAFVYGLGGPEDRVYLPARDFNRHLHETLGMLVILLTLVRVLWKAFDKAPRVAGLPRWMELASSSVQGLLYVLLLAVPLSAMVGAWLEGHAVVLLGGISLASPLAQSHALGVTVSNVHTLLGDAIMWLAGAHALAALYHHFLLRDGVLLTMLPQSLGRMLPGVKPL